jgi:MFS family permease
VFILRPVDAVLESVQRMKKSGSRIDDFHIYLLSAFVADLFLPIFYIFVPLLAYRLGADPFELGLVGGAIFATYFFLPVLIGRFSDRLGTRRLFVAIALSILALVSFVYSIASGPLTIIAGRLLEGVAWAILWPTLMAGISHDAQRDAKRSLSLYNFVWSGAAVVGPPVGSLLVFLTSYQTTFFITAIMLVVAVGFNLVTGFQWRRVKAKEKAVSIATSLDSSLNVQPEGRSTDTPTSQNETNARRTIVAFFVTANALSSMTWVTMFTFFPALSESIGIPVLILGAISLAATGGRFLTYLVITKESFRRRLLDVRNRNRNMVVLLALMPIPALLFLIPDRITFLYFVSFAIVGIIDASVATIALVGIVAEAEPSRAGAAAGLFESSTGIASFFGPIIAGALAGGSLVVPLIFPALGMFVVLVAFGVLAGLFRRR